MISSHQIQATDSSCTSDITTFLYLQELTNIHLESKSRLSAICQSSSHARHSCFCLLYVCVWVGGFEHICACVSYMLFAYLTVYICSVIWKFVHPNAHILMLKHENKQSVNCLYSVTAHYTVKANLYCTETINVSFLLEKSDSRALCCFSQTSKPCRLILNHNIELTLSSSAVPQMPH